jgi:hypothetical protein
MRTRGGHGTPPDLVGAGNSATLCDLVVFVEESAEPISSDDLHIGIGRMGQGT